MVFSSLIFLFLFLPTFLLCYFIPKKRKTKNIVLLIFSLLFYGYGEPIYVLLMILSIIVNYFIVLWMDKSSKPKKWLIIDLVFNLGLLFFFKYTNFFLDNINNLFNFNIKFLSISLPIGISFYTFQILTYVIDVYKSKVPVQKSIINLGCYISAFPQLIAGPIVRYETVNEELNDRCEDIEGFATGIRRFIIGLFKKCVIANEMAYVADTLFGSSIASLGTIGMIVGGVAFTFQIYFDFSGYSDMAIGLGKMLGFNYLENFNYPYVARTITDFWRRWHISLSTFFRDYVYIPLGGNRCKRVRHIFNLFVVWALTGLWHGASWNFVFWGLFYFILLVLEKFIFKKIDKLPAFLGHLYTFSLVTFGFIIFYFTDTNTLIEAIKTLFGAHGLGNMMIFTHYQIFKLKTIIIFVLSAFASTPIFKPIFDKKNKFSDIYIIILFIISIISILASSYNPFIYFRF